MKTARCSATDCSPLLLLNPDEGRRGAAQRRRRHLHKCLLSWIYGEWESKKVDVLVWHVDFLLFSLRDYRLPPLPNAAVRQRFEMSAVTKIEFTPTKNNNRLHNTLNGIVSCSFVIYDLFHPFRFAGNVDCALRC